MSVRMEPPKVVLRPSPPKAVHDVGEYVVIKTAHAPNRVKVVAEDPVTQRPLNAVVHLDGEKLRANQPFEHDFRSEQNGKTLDWSKELIWVECPGYEASEVDYKVVVAR